MKPTVMKRALKTVVVLLAGFLATLQVARAQEVAAYLGLGGTYVTSNGSQIDTFRRWKLCIARPAWTEYLPGLGREACLSAGIGALARNWPGRLRKGTYASLQYRPSFYSFVDGIFSSGTRNRETAWLLSFRAGIGG